MRSFLDDVHNSQQSEPDNFVHHYRGTVRAGCAFYSSILQYIHVVQCLGVAIYDGISDDVIRSSSCASVAFVCTRFSHVLFVARVSRCALVCVACSSRPDVNPILQNRKVIV